MTRTDRPAALHARLSRPDSVAPGDVAAWRALVAATPAFASPLLGPEFAALVGDVREDARVAVFHQGGEVVGVLAHHRRPGGVARPIGAPWSDAHALLTWPDRPLSWREALAAADVRSFRFSQLVDPHGVFAGVTTATAPSHLLLADPDGGEAAWERLRAGSPKRFKNIRRLEHKLERDLGPLVFGSERSRDAFDRLILWKRDQFARTGAHDVLHPIWSRAFLDAAFELDGEGLRGDVLTLRAGGRLVAAHFGVRSHAVFHPWLAAFDPELREYSPGLLFMSQLVRASLGLDRYELSAGSDDYKTVFAGASEPVASGVADLRLAPGAAHAPRLTLVEKMRSRLDHIAEVDITFADRVHGVTRAVLDAPRLLRHRASTPHGNRLMAVITDWTDDKARRFGKGELALRHDLHTRPLFDDAGLERVLDLYPRERLGVFTMGDDPVDWRSWRRGAAQGLTGSQLLEAAHAGRIWLNLRRVDEAIPDYAALLVEIFDDLESHAPGLSTFKRDMGLLISSANAQVFYHLDVPLVTLWGLRGEKTLYVYPPEGPFVEPAELEAIVLRDKPEQFAFDPAWDARAEVFHMQPGDMITWRQNAPHRVVNGPMLNVSLSIEFMTRAALMRANVIYANGVLRRRAGLSPAIQEGLGPASLAKFGLARAAKAVRRTPERTAPPPAFRLDAAQPGALLPL